MFGTEGAVGNEAAGSVVAIVGTVGTETEAASFNLATTSLRNRLLFRPALITSNARC
jgi:hypothetical protein